MNRFQLFYLKKNPIMYLRHYQYPKLAKVEFTRRCNLRCEMCIRPYLEKYPDMTLEKFKIVLDELKGLITLSPIGYGEPLLHPHFLEMMEEASKRGIKVHLTTNGMLLNHELSAAFLERCHPEKIVFSVDAASEDLYQNIRKGSNFKVVYNNIQQCLTNRKKLSESTIIVLYCTIGDWNVHEIEKMFEMGVDLGVDQLSLSDIRAHGKGWAKSERAIRKSEFKEKFEGVFHHLYKRYAGKIKANFRTLSDIKYSNDFNCWLLEGQTFIQANGDVYPCTDNIHPDFKYGNIFEDGFKNIWFGKRRKKFIENFKKHKLNECIECNSYAKYKR